VGLIIRNGAGMTDHFIVGKNLAVSVGTLSDATIEHFYNAIQGKQKFCEFYYTAGSVRIEWVDRWDICRNILDGDFLLISENALSNVKDERKTIQDKTREPILPNVQEKIAKYNELVKAELAKNAENGANDGARRMRVLLEDCPAYFLKMIHRLDDEDILQWQYRIMKRIKSLLNFVRQYGAGKSE